jgi:hypothetical protein
VDVVELIVGALAIGLIVAGTLALWASIVTTRRRALARARARATAHLDALAAQVCESLAAGETRRHEALLRRYERLRDELARARSLRELHRIAARARADAVLWRARGAVEDAIGRASDAGGAELAREAVGAARAWWALARTTTGR